MKKRSTLLVALLRALFLLGIFASWLLLGVAVSRAAPAGLHAQASAEPASLGEMLYSTHCIACHTTQMHWRDNRVATDWGSLNAQVRSWQARNRLQWTDAEIAEVARHLNETIYHYPQTGNTLSWLASH